jgi:hypothetical protein
MIPTQAAFAAKMLAVAQEFVGIDRAQDLPQIGRFLGLFGLDAIDGGQFVPFCAAGVSWSACKAYAELVGAQYTEATAPAVFQHLLPAVHALSFVPSASCGEIWRDAISRGSWVSNAGSDHLDVQAGWLVLYDWPGNGVPDHVEIIINAGDDLQTVGFNTSGESHGDQVNGGAVALKTRNYDNVLGFVRTWAPAAALHSGQPGCE